MVVKAACVVLFVVAISGCGTDVDPLSGCPSGVACGGGCCANAAEVCVKDSSGAFGCAPSCNSRGDCASGCCAPLKDGAGNVVGPYVCQASNACCYTTICPGSSCCVADGDGNEFCADPCTGSGTCGGGSVCQAYDFAHTTCAGPRACGP